MSKRITKEARGSIVEVREIPGSGSEVVTLNPQCLEPLKLKTIGATHS